MHSGYADRRTVSDPKEHAQVEKHCGQTEANGRSPLQLFIGGSLLATGSECSRLSALSVLYNERTAVDCLWFSLGFLAWFSPLLWRFAVEFCCDPAESLAVLLNGNSLQLESLNGETPSRFSHWLHSLLAYSGRLFAMQTLASRRSPLLAVACHCSAWRAWRIRMRVHFASEQPVGCHSKRKCSEFAGLPERRSERAAPTRKHKTR